MQDALSQVQSLSIPKHAQARNREAIFPIISFPQTCVTTVNHPLCHGCQPYFVYPQHTTVAKIAFGVWLSNTSDSKRQRQCTTEHSHIATGGEHAWPNSDHHRKQVSLYKRSDVRSLTDIARLVGRTQIDVVNAVTSQLHFHESLNN